VSVSADTILLLYTTYFFLIIYKKNDYQFKSGILNNMKHLRLIILTCVILLCIACYYYFKPKPSSWFKLTDELKKYNIKSKKKCFSIIKPSLPYQVYEYTDAISKDRCMRLRRDATSLLTQYKNSHTTFMTCTLKTKDALKLRTIASTLTGVPLTHIDEVKINKYQDGENGYEDISSTHMATLLFYLNDGFIGGESEFPAIPKIILPEEGKAILFWNTLGGDTIPESECNESYVITGVKWVALVRIYSENS
jgi:hypothetical protein